MKKLKNKKVLIIACAAILAIVAVVLIIVLNRKESFRSVTVNDQSGSVDLERNQNVIEIAKDMKLIPNDFVTVGDESLLDLLVDEDKHIAVRSSTKFSVDAVGNPKEGLVTINVTEGKSYIKIDNPLEPEDGFQVVTPNATISVRGTIFTVDYNPNLGITRVECVEGKVNVISNSGDEIDLLAGDVVEVIDTMTTGTLTQQEMDAIVNVFLGGNGVVETEFLPEEKDNEANGGAEETETENDIETELACMTAEEIMQANAGDVVTYGTYGITFRKYKWSSDGNIETDRTSNPVTPIEWIVIANDGGSVTLLSKYEVDILPYSSERGAITWEDSCLRLWLNQDFYGEAFTETEKAHIQTTTCVNEDNPYWGANGLVTWVDPGEEDYPAGGNDTKDKVYLLSLEELEQYFGITAADFYSFYYEVIDLDEYWNLCDEKLGGLLKSECATGEFEGWWLRSPGYASDCVAYVSTNDAVDMSGTGAMSCIGVRPVIRIGL
ncbi:MAG: FecR family protein [Lachnospiraceae bacterium]|nr:FecR family protein [Lachnospiraceae bacterium]